MKPYHSVAMYNQAVQALELPRKPHHHPPSQLLSATSLKLPFSLNDFCLKSLRRLQGRCLLAKQAHLNVQYNISDLDYTEASNVHLEVTLPVSDDHTK